LSRSGRNGVQLNFSLGECRLDVKPALNEMTILKARGHFQGAAKALQDQRISDRRKHDTFNY
jgi:hypothetical protein